jgi:cytosine/uracil/thiamine/allantoin permease
MKTDKILIAVYLILGIFFGYISNYLNKTLSSLTLALLAPIILYIVSQPVLFRLVKNKKKTWLISNSFVTFIFVWLIVWIMLHNI